MTLIMASTKKGMKKQKEKGLSFIDLFCGAGGFSYGLIKAGLTHKFGLDSCEDCPSIKETYSANCGEFIKAKIEDFDFKQYKGIVDVVVGSPPCKSFSVANTKTRNLNTKLIKEFYLAVTEIKPKYWVWENVQGVNEKLSNQKKLVESDEVEAPFVLNVNMLDFGMLQMRKRTFVSNFKIDLKPIEKTWLEDKRAWSVFMHDRGNIIKPFYTVTAHGSRRGGNFGLHLLERKKGLRHLTLPELANIQTFPFYYKFFGSHTAIETQIGNAVPPYFSYLIGKELLVLEEKK